MRFTPKKAVVIGAGSIGTEFSKQAQLAGYKVPAMVNSRGATGAFPVTFKGRGNTEEIGKFVRYLFRYVRPDLAAFALPSGGDGSTELSLMMPFLKSGIPVVTAGKSAVAEQYDKLAPYLHLVGRTATVGGGTRILHFLKQWLNPVQPFDVGMVVNGTLSFIMGCVWRGHSLELATQKAVEAKFAEPPSEGETLSPLKIFLGEIEDVARKTTITLNELGYRAVGKKCKQDDLKIVPLDQDYLNIVTNHAARMKYAVWIGAETSRPLAGLVPDAPGSISGQFGPMFVRAGFYHVPLGGQLEKWVPDDASPENALCAEQFGNRLVISGPGAGPGPTAASMLFDAERLTGGHEPIAVAYGPWLRDLGAKTLPTGGLFGSEPQYDLPSVGAENRT